MKVQLFFGLLQIQSNAKTHKNTRFSITQKFYLRNSLIIKGCFMQVHCKCIASA